MAAGPRPAARAKCESRVKLPRFPPLSRFARAAQNSRVSEYNSAATTAPDGTEMTQPQTALPAKDASVASRARECHYSSIPVVVHTVNTTQARAPIDREKSNT